MSRWKTAHPDRYARACLKLYSQKIDTPELAGMKILKRSFWEKF